MKKLSLMLALLLTLSFASFAPDALAKTSKKSQGADFALLVYMCGTDLESRYGSATSDLSEMMNAGLPSDGSICVMVQTGGTTKWQNDFVKASRSERFLMTNQLYLLDNNLGQLNMGDPQTLQDFITYAMDNLPAQRYGLVLWDHGSGATGGVCYDERTHDSLNMPEIYQALSGALKGRNQKFDFIGFDACLMATYSMSLTLADFTHYIIASEELEPASGWAYDAWLSALVQNPNISTPQLGKVIVDSFVESALKQNPNDYVTLSLVDASQMSNVREAVDKFGSALKGQLDGGQLSAISRARAGMRSFGEYADAQTDMVDVAAMAAGFQNLVPNEAQGLYDAVHSAVIYNRNSAKEKGACGMSILVPYRTRENAGQYMSVYDPMGLTPNYTAFMTDYIQKMQSGSHTFTPSSMQSSSINASDEDAQSWLNEFISGQQTGVGSGSWLNELLGGLSTDQQSQSSGSDYTSSSQQGTATGELDLGSLLGGLLGDTQQGDGYGGGQQTVGGSLNLGSLLQGLLGDEDTYHDADADIQTNNNGWVDSANVSTDDLTNDHYQQVAQNFNGSAYTVTLGQQDLQNLSYVEGSLLQDASADFGGGQYGQDVYFDLGSTQNVHIDWKTGEIRGMFDGQWPTLNGQTVVMIDQVVTAGYVRSIIPVMVNNQQQYIVVVFNEDNPDGVIMGYSQGYDENGNPARGYQQFKRGDVVVPVYDLMYWDTNDNPQYAEFAGEQIVIGKQEIQFTYSRVEAGNYFYAFRLNDIYGGYQYTDFVEMQYN